VLNRWERGADHPQPSSAEVEERVELYVYSPSGPSRPVPGWTVPYMYTHWGLAGELPERDRCVVSVKRLLLE